MAEVPIELQAMTENSTTSYEIQQEAKSVEFKMTPFTLNKFFEVVYYDGEKENYASYEKRIVPVTNILKAPSEVPEEIHCTKEGSNFDLVLKFTPDSDFTLTGFCVRGASGCTSVIKDGLMWIHDSPPDISKYTKNYNDFTRNKFHRLQHKSHDEPVLFFETDPDSYFFQTSFNPNLVGKYIHIKFMTPHQKSGNNIDLGYIAFVGFPEKRKTPYVGIIPPELDLAPPEVSLPVISGDPLYSIRSEALEYITILEHEKLIYVVSRDHFVRSFNVETGKMISQLFISAYISAIAVNEERIFGIGIDKIGAWDRQTGKLLGFWETDKISTYKGHAIALHKDTLVTGHSDGKIAIWNIRTCQCEASYVAHFSTVTGLAITEDEIFSTSYDQRIVLYHRSNGQIVRKTAAEALLGLAVGPKRVYAVGFFNCQVHVFDRHDLNLVKRVPETAKSSELEGEEGWSSVTYAHGKIFVGTNVGTISVWEEESGSLIQRLRGHSNSVTSLAHWKERFFSLSNESIKFWNSREIKGLNLVARNVGKIKDMVYANNHLYAGCTDKNIRVIDSRSGRVVNVLTGHDDIVTSVAVIDDTLFSASKDETVKIWNRKDGTLEYSIVHDAPVLTMAAQDDKLYTGTDDGSLNIYDNNYEKTESFVVEGRRCIRIIPTPELLVTAWEDGVRIWNSTQQISQKNVLFLPLTHTNSTRITKLVVEVTDVQRVRTSSESYPLFSIELKDSTTKRTKFKIRKKYTEFVELKDKLEAKFATQAKQFANFPVLGEKPTEKDLQSTRSALDNYLQSVVRIQELLSDPDLLNFVSATLSALAVTPQRLCVGFKDGTMKVLDMTTLGSDEQNLYEVQAHPRKITDMIAFKSSLLYTASTDETIKIFQLSTGNCLFILRGHRSSLSNAILVEEKLYSSAFDQTIRMWNVPLIMAPEHCHKVHNVPWLKEYAKTKTPDIDLLEVACSCGLIEPVKFLLSANPKLKFNQPRAFGEPSPLYYALTNNRWNFLRELGLENVVSKTEFEIKDRPSLEFLRHKARDDDDEFFDNLAKSGVKFPQVDVVGYSFLFPNTTHYKVVSSWLQRHDVNQRGTSRETLLHYAANYGSVRGVEMLLADPGILLNVTDENRLNPVHRALSDNNSQLTGHRGRRSLHQLNLDRITCAKLLLQHDDPTNKVDLLAQSGDRETVYTQVLIRYNRARKDMKGTEPRRSNEPLNEVAMARQRKSTFTKTVELLDICNEEPQIKGYRNTFANINFWKKAGPYMVWLFLLVLVAMGRSTKDSAYSYWFKNSVERIFVLTEYQDVPPRVFTDVDTIDEFWSWFDRAFLPGLNQLEWEYDSEFLPNSDNSTLFVSGHRLIGSARVSLKRAKNICPQLLNNRFPENYFSVCTGTYFEESTEPYGTGPEPFIFQKNATTSFFGTDVWRQFEAGGFFQKFSGNLTDSLEKSRLLQEWGYVDTFTRVISIDFTIFNINLNLFLTTNFLFEFTPSGRLLPSVDYNTFKGFRVENSFDKFLIFVEIIIVLFFFVEFVVQEIYELQRKGFKKYAADLWNYYEWIIILLFVSLVGLRIYAYAEVSRLLPLGPDEFFDFLQPGRIFKREQDVIGFFILICFLRGLKFLRIPTDIGPASQTILDTVVARQFVVFMGMFFFVFLAFSLAFHFMFGMDVYDFRNFEVSMLLMARMLFGDFEVYEQLHDSNRVLGPLLFIFFIITLVLIFLNLLIAVLSETYSNIFKKNTETYQQYVTYLLIKDLYFTSGKSSAFDWFAMCYSFILNRIFGRSNISRPAFRFRRNTLETNQLSLESTGEAVIQLAKEVLSKKDTKFSNLTKKQMVFNYKQLDRMELEIKYARNHISNEEISSSLEKFKQEVNNKLNVMKEDIQKETVKSIHEEITVIHTEVHSMLNRVEQLLQQTTQKN